MPDKKDVSYIEFNKAELEVLVNNIVKELIIDINHRSGLGASFRMIDAITKKEMIERWHFLVGEQFKDFE